MNAIEPVLAADAPEVEAPKKKRKKKTSPTQRSLKLMRERGYICQVVERWNPFAHVLQDLFGVIDVLCLGDDEIVGVQTTTSENMASRITKIADHENTPHLRKAGMRLIVHGWKKGADRKWVVRETDVS